MLLFFPLKELEFTRAELDGRQFPLNPEISDLEPGLDFPIFQAEVGNPFNQPFYPPSGRGKPADQPHRKRENGGTPRKRPPYANDVPFNQWFAPPGGNQAPGYGHKGTYRSKHAWHK